MQVDQNTLNLIVFAEQMAALAAKTIVDLKNVITGNSTKAVDDILADADATYQTIIAAAQAGQAPPTVPPTTT